MTAHVTDKQLLTLENQEPRLTYREIAERCGQSPQHVGARLRQLREFGRRNAAPLWACERCGGLFKIKRGNANRFCSYICANNGQARDDEFVLAARKLWDLGYTISAAGRKLGVTRNVVVGVAHRNHFPPRKSPIKRPKD